MKLTENPISYLMLTTRQWLIATLDCKLCVFRIISANCMYNCQYNLAIEPALRPHVFCKHSILSPSPYYHLLPAELLLSPFSVTDLGWNAPWINLAPSLADSCCLGAYLWFYILHLRLIDDCRHITGSPRCWPWPPWGLANARSAALALALRARARKARPRPRTVYVTVFVVVYIAFMPYRWLSLHARSNMIYNIVNIL